MTTKVKVETMAYVEGQKVVFDGKVYDFGYYTAKGGCVLYEEGEENMQDSIAVKSAMVRPATQPPPDTGRSGTVEQLDGSVATFWPPRKTDAPDTGGEWRVEAMPTRGWRVVDATGQEVVADVYRKEDAARVVSDHNAVQFALHFGRNWTLTDWQNWLRWHATKERQ
jgi:hypothetical protein